MTALAVSRRHPATALHVEHRGAELVLRPLALSDAAELVRAVEESVKDLLRFMPWAHAPNTVEGQLQRIQAALTPNATGQDFTVGLFDARTQRFLVGCGLHPRTALNPGALEVGYWTRSGQTGRGLATLATQVLTVYALEGLGTDRVQVSHNTDNVASRRVIEKCGFKREGIVRNLISAPTVEQVAGGHSPGREYVQYALLPEDRAGLEWYAPLRDRIRVVNLVGEDLGFAWRA